MSPLLSRILMTTVLCPLAGVINFLLVIATDDHLDGPLEVSVPALLTAAFMIVFWVLVWRKLVRWTRRRMTMTFIAGGGAAAISAVIAIGMMYATYPSFDGDAAIYIGIILSALLWMAGTTFVWRETAAEKAERHSRAGADSVICPACSYDLKGLREARCPECGTQYALDELFASQPSRAAAEIEQS
jgi:hypothetical protein